ncbi:unnamed protein product, partial [Ectocarpus sp. 12 AP-2014]
GGDDDADREAESPPPPLRAPLPAAAAAAAGLSWPCGILSTTLPTRIGRRSHFLDLGGTRNTKRPRANSASARRLSSSLFSFFPLAAAAFACASVGLAFASASVGFAFASVLVGLAFARLAAAERRRPFSRSAAGTFISVSESESQV